MIPRELLKALRKIEITTNRLATEQLSGMAQELQRLMGQFTIGELDGNGREKLRLAAVSAGDATGDGGSEKL